MANTNLTHQMIAREAAKILMEESPFIANINKGRQDEFGEAIGGYKKGDTVKIGVHSVNAVYSGAVFAGGGATPDNVENYVNLQLNTQKHVPLAFGAKEKLLEVSDFKERILRPQMRALSSVVEADLLSQAVQATPSLVGTVGSVPTTMKTYAQARAKLEAYLAPVSDRSMIYSSNANIELVDASKALFSAKSEIERGFLRGMLGEAQGADFYEHQSIAAITNGTQATGFAVNGSIVEGATSLAAKSLTNAATLKKGQIFTIAGIFSVHPLTGTATTDLQQFVVTSDVTNSGTTGSIPCYPAIKASAPNKTVSALPTDGLVVTLVGAVSTAYKQNIMFQKDAFTAAFAPLPVLASCEGYTARLPNGMSVRVMTFGDGVNDLEKTRIDVLYGFAAVRPLHACRVTE